MGRGSDQGQGFFRLGQSARRGAVDLAGGLPNAGWPASRGSARRGMARLAGGLPGVGQLAQRPASAGGESCWRLIHFQAASVLVQQDAAAVWNVERP